MPQTTLIMIIDSDNKECQAIKNALEEEHYNVITASSAKDMREKIKTNTPDIVLLDLMLADANGLTLLRDLHDKTHAKIIMVASKDSITEKVISLELGADDYITRPFDMREMVARINARFRRHKETREILNEISKLKKNYDSDITKIRFGDWILDRSQWQAFDKNGTSANLTPREFHILETLVMEGNRVLSRDHIIEKAWDNNNTTDRAVDIQILRIRKKIGDKVENNPIIKSVRGVGYQLIPKVENIQ